MRKQYDFSRARRNPYAGRLKRQLTIRLDESTIRYFTELAVETGIPYQTLINLYLRDCVMSRRRLTVSWMRARKRAAASRAFVGANHPVGRARDGGNR